MAHGTRRCALDRAAAQPHSIHRRVPDGSPRAAHGHRDPGDRQRSLRRRLADASSDPPPPRLAPVGRLPGGDRRRPTPINGRRKNTRRSARATPTRASRARRPSSPDVGTGSGVTAGRAASSGPVGDGSDAGAHRPAETHGQRWRAGGRLRTRDHRGVPPTRIPSDVARQSRTHRRAARSRPRTRPRLPGDRRLQEHESRHASARRSTGTPSTNTASSTRPTTRSSSHRASAAAS